MPRLLTIGECMVELRQSPDGALHQGFAGDMYNSAYYARLALPADWDVDFFSAFGTDRVSKDMLAAIAAHGIGTDLSVKDSPRNPGLYMIHLDRGERSFSYWRGQSAARLLAADRQKLEAAVTASDIVLFSGITLAILEGDGFDTMISVLGTARAAGKTIAFDPNIRPRLWPDADEMRRKLMAGAGVASIALPSFDDDAAHFGDADRQATIARYHKAGASMVVLKDGERGAVVSDGHTMTEIPAVRAEAVVDTTGAGDSFNGTFLGAVGLGALPVEAARKAAGVAASVIGHHGALVAPEHIRTERP